MKMIALAFVTILAYGFLCYSMGKNVGELKCYFEKVSNERTSQSKPDSFED